MKLNDWNEIVGTLKNIRKKNGELLLDFLFEVSIPIVDNDRRNLDEYVGKNIGILKTDNIDEPYKIRLIESKG